MTSSPCQDVTTMVSQLGGPSISPAHIEWALDIPAGKRLIEWLAAQLRDGTPVQTCLKMIALEDEEVQTLKRGKAQHGHGVPADSSEEDVDLQILPGYTLPSVEKQRIQFMDDESTLLAAEASRIQQRIRLSKAATQESIRTIEALRSAIECADAEIHEAKESLSELSLLADGTLSSSVSVARQLVQSFPNANEAHEVNQGTNPTTPRAPRKADPEDWHATLAALARVRNEIIEMHQTDMHTIDDAEAALPSPEDLDQEARRIHDAWLGLAERRGDDTLQELAEAGAFQQQLDAICDKLQRENALPETSVDDTDCPDDNVIPDVKGGLELAWNRDQAAILTAKGEVLDRTLQMFDRSVVSPLQQLHAHLLRSKGFSERAEALVATLLLEMEESVDDACDAKEFPQHQRHDSDSKAELWKSALSSLFKSLEDCRPKDAPPLILLNEDDFINEIRSVVAWSNDAQEEAKKWPAALRARLSALTSAQTPLLSAIYQDAPLNTSPPFAQRQQVRELEEQAKDTAERLDTDVTRLQKEVEASARTGKLDQFIEGWAR